MNRFFYQKLAWLNLKKNKSTYIPYILTGIGSVVAFYIMASIAENKGLSQMMGEENLRIILNLGKTLVGIFSAVFLFYTNSFLIKRRKKEIGLYSILGLEKRHIGRVLFYETLFSGAIAMVIGLMIGLVFSKLMFLILLNILVVPEKLAFEISFSAMGLTLLLFGGIFLCILFKNFLQVKLTNPIKLLKGDKEGEKEPKTSWIFTVIGLLALGAGYGIALTTRDPMSSLMLFFLAVLCVIIGTYALFTSGSIALLKALKKNKKFFYKQRNFISVSGMIYRMKQNAVGLANICILSTMVLVTLATTTSLYLGQQDILRSRYPYEFTVSGDIETGDRGKIKNFVALESEIQGVKVINAKESEILDFIAYKEDTKFRPLTEADERDLGIYSKVSRFNVMSLEDYNRNENKNETLLEGEAIIFTNRENYGKESITFGEQTFQIAKEIEGISFSEKEKYPAVNVDYLIVNDIRVLEERAKTFGKERVMQSVYNFDLEGSEEAKKAFTDSLFEKAPEACNTTSLDSLYRVKESLNFMFGGFLFLGLFLGALFIMATALIIYFKQISEGYDDHDRFEIMQKVGMDKKEIKGTIRKQILMVFFLPLVTAVLHTAVAFPIYSKLLAAFNLMNLDLIFWCTLISILVFGVLYGIVYALTAKVYYKLVR